MATAKITLIGLTNYDPDLFENLTLPDGIDADLVKNTIIMEAGDLGLLYADADFMKDAIGVWSKKWYRTFQKWYEALQIDYSPLENYDRKEEWTDTGEGSNSGTNTGSASDQTDYSVTAYEDDKLHQKDRTKGSSSSTMRASGEYENENVHTGRVHGNIGVTTSQQMLQSELEIAEWNLVQHIADLFISEFCLLVYI